MKADLIIFNIGQLITARYKKLPVKPEDVHKNFEIINNAYIIIKDGNIIDIGKDDKYKEFKSENLIDAKGRVVLPGFVDSHTHLVFAGSRVKEFLMRLSGKSYMEIYKSGGGIYYTVEKTRKASINQLLDKSLKYLNLALKHGTTSIEIKSGYGLDFDTEVKILKVIKRLKEISNLDIFSTYLGAHSIDLKYKDNRSEFINQVINTMQFIKKEKLADFIDVFADEGAINYKETEKIFKSAFNLGLDIRVHSDEFKSMAIVPLAVKYKALSVDHLLKITDEDIKILANSNTIATLMPGTSFFIGENFAPAEKLVKNNVSISLATDFNAGSCQTLSMQMVLSLAVLKLKLSVEQSIIASTINPAYSLKASKYIGSIEKGKQADIVIYNLSDYKQLPFLFGVNLVNTVIKKGKILYKEES